MGFQWSSMDGLKGLSWVDQSFVIERTENFKAVRDHGFRCKRKSGFFLPKSVFWIQMGKMVGVICGMMNFPGLRFVPSKKKKKKKVGSVC